MKKARTIRNVSMVVIILITYSSMVHAQTENNRNPLGHAVHEGDVSAVKALLSKGADPNKTFDQETPLAISAKLESDEIFNILVNTTGIKIDALSTFIWTGNGSTDTHTALMAAVNSEKVGRVRTLLAKGADVDIFGKVVEQNGSITISTNALMDAILLINEEGVEMLEMLIEKSKNLDALTPYVKKTVSAPIMVCRYPLYNEVAKKMFQKGAKFEISPTNSPGYTAIGAAITGSNPEMVKFLLNAGAKVNDQTDKAFMHLSLALVIENIETISLLLDSGIDPDIRFSSTKYPVINTCVKCKNLKVLELMVKKGANVNAKDAIGQSVLAYAKGGRKVKKNVKYLIKQGAK